MSNSKKLIKDPFTDPNHFVRGHIAELEYKKLLTDNKEHKHVYDCMISTLKKRRINK